MQCMAKVLEVKNNAHIKILQHKSFSDVTPSEIPVYFKLGELTDVKVESAEIHILMSDRLPIANCGDGVAVYLKATRVGAKLCGFICCDYRCSSYSIVG